MGKRKKRGKANTTQSAVNEDCSNEAVENEIEDRTNNQKYTVDDLLDRVSIYMENFDYELALKFCQKALGIEPDNLRIVETCGNVCAEMGDLENAKMYYRKAIELEKDKGHVKYLYLGQISQGMEAVGYYETALKIMKEVIEYNDNNLTTNSSNLQTSLTQRDVSSVYCSLAEIFMTDCCMNEGAEKQCETYCKQSLEADQDNLEAYTVMCNFLLSSNDLESAKSSGEKAFELWKRTTDSNEDSIPEHMAYETRINLIKILLEIECYDKVSSIVDQLIEENEDDVRIWYYLGLAKSLMNSSDNPRFYLEKALELFEISACEDEDMLQHINELLVKCPLEDGVAMEALPEEEEEEDASNKDVTNSCMDVEE